MNILALSVSTKVLLIKSLKEACNSSSRKLFCADSSVDSPALYFGDNFVIVPKISSQKLLDFLLNYCSSNDITFIIPTSDHDLVFLVTVREKLQIHGIKVLMSDSSTISNCISKFKFNEICDNNISIPSIYSCLEDITYPCVAKLDVSQASEGVFILESQQDLNTLLEKYDFSEIIFQEFIDSQEYTIDSFYGNNGELICALPRERLKVVNGESTISKTVYVQDLIDLAGYLPSVFNFLGHVTIQAFYNGSKIHVIEINPRFGGASNLSFNAGLNSPEWTLHLINKDYELIHENDIKYNLKMLRYSQDYFYEV